jgi:hypothetical protein
MAVCDRNGGSVPAIYGAGHPAGYGGSVYIAKSRPRAFPRGFFLENMRNRVRLAARAVISLQQVALKRVGDKRR